MPRFRRSHSSGLSRLDEEPSGWQLPPVPLRSRSADTPLNATALAHATNVRLNANVGAILAASQQQLQQQQRPASAGQPGPALPQHEVLLQVLSQIQQQQQQQQLPPVPSGSRAAGSFANGSHPVGASLSWSTAAAHLQ